MKTGRRLAAIMTTDVVGYSRLMGLDERGTLHALNAHRANLIDPSIAAHGGRIVKTMGDGLLVEFASVVHAVSCAVALQRGMHARNADIPPGSQLVLRIGINIGDIIIDGHDIFGDGVNIAARLEAMSSPGGICISDIAYQQVRDKLPLAFADIGPQDLKNIARPVQAYALDPAAILAADDLPPPETGRAPMGGSGGAAARPAPRDEVPRLRRRSLIIAASTVLLAIVCAGAGWTLLRAPAVPVTASAPKALADRQQIAILPLRTIGGGDEYFADGLTEDIIAALGRFPELSVRARSAVMAYKDHPATPAAIGQALDVRYIVEGSVRRADDRVRAEIRLIDVSVGAVLWSETYDAEVKDIFVVQDDITRRVAGTLAVHLNTLAVADAAAKPVANLEAYDLVQRGRERLNRLSRSSNNDARVLFERAVALDPTYAPAYVGLAQIDLNLVNFGWTGAPQDTLARAISRAKNAVALQPDNPAAHAVLGRAFDQAGDYDEALTGAQAGCGPQSKRRRNVSRPRLCAQRRRRYRGRDQSPGRRRALPSRSPIHRVLRPRHQLYSCGPSGRCRSSPGTEQQHRR